MPRPRKPSSPFRYFNSSPEIIRLAVMMYVRFTLSLRNVEDFLFERGDRLLGKQPVRERPLVVPNMLAGDAQVLAHEDPTEVRLGPCQCP